MYFVYYQVLQGSLQGGVMNEFHNDKRVYICDRFFLGGPTSVRGFDSRGAGPHSEHCALGSEVMFVSFCLKKK
jgi:outer membrane protein insertion porin family